MITVKTQLMCHKSVLVSGSLHVTATFVTSVQTTLIIFPDKRCIYSNHLRYEHLLQWLHIFEPKKGENLYVLNNEISTSIKKHVNERLRKCVLNVFEWRKRLGHSRIDKLYTKAIMVVSEMCFVK